MSDFRIEMIHIQESLHMLFTMTKKENYEKKNHGIVGEIKIF